MFASISRHNPRIFLPYNEMPHSGGLKSCYATRMKGSMNRLSPYFISAICTPLTADDRLHEEGLATHLEHQWAYGINGVLVAGTMGLLQLLQDEVYQQLCRRTVEVSKRRGEIMIGAGDASLARTLGRVEFLNTLAGVDGVVVLTPYFIQFSQPELIDYYTAIADASKAPVYLYDLPQRTRSKIEISTVQALIRHPNIRGIKCSDEIVSTRQLIETLGGKTRLVVAQPLITDLLLKFGIQEHLDGMFALAPGWTVALGKAAAEGNWEQAASYQQKIMMFATVLRDYGVFPAATALLNALGIPGRLGPRPFRMLSEERQREMLGSDTIRRWIAENRML